jgi:hypothetical protein
MPQRLWIRWRAGTASRRLLASIGCGFLFVGLYLVAVRTAAGQDMDDRAFELVYSLAPPGTVALMTWFARGFVIVLLAALVLLLTLAAAHRHAWRSVAVALIIVGLTVLTTTFLRDDLLTRPSVREETFPENSLPSTHVSVACALVVAAVVLWPPRRPWWLVNAACLVVLLAALGNVLAQAHRVSDVVASVLLVGAVSGLSVALLRPTRQPPAQPFTRRLRSDPGTPAAQTDR